MIVSNLTQFNPLSFALQFSTWFFGHLGKQSIFTIFKTLLFNIRRFYFVSWPNCNWMAFILHSFSFSQQIFSPFYHLCFPIDFLFSCYRFSFVVHYDRLQYPIGGLKFVNNERCSETALTRSASKFILQCVFGTTCEVAVKLAAIL